MAKPPHRARLSDPCPTPFGVDGTSGSNRVACPGSPVAHSPQLAGCGAVQPNPGEIGRGRQWRRPTANCLLAIELLAIEPSCGKAGHRPLPHRRLRVLADPARADL